TSKNCHSYPSKRNNEKERCCSMDGDDVIMSSVEESARMNMAIAGSSSDVQLNSESLCQRTSNDVHRSEDEFEVAQPTTSSYKLPPSPTYVDTYLQEILLSSPAHLFSCGLLPADQLSASWEQWLCYLACSLTPHQWQKKIFFQLRADVVQKYVGPLPSAFSEDQNLNQCPSKPAEPSSVGAEN
ncbi:hypothetical protein GCK32_003245, partial [Trichostrongylus colubriformis]